ncbi:MAG TPA: hypothetical protein PKC21_06570 [Oligoflexia bacterium]|nr:hypothetical protein [Oligoflexia bacterium]HMR24999.1 hypothetical protein [Oligoflexia bacterium]
MKYMQTYKQSSLLLLMTALSMGLASCFPDSRPQQGLMGNGVISNGRSVEIGGDGINGNNNGLNNGNNNGLNNMGDPNQRNVNQPDPNQEQPQTNGLRFTKRTEELWEIACSQATLGDIGMKIDDPSNPGTQIPDPTAIEPRGEPDSDNDEISDNCELYLSNHKAFEAMNPQLLHGYGVGVVRLSAPVLSKIAVDAATINGSEAPKYKEAWNTLAGDWADQAEGTGFINNITSRSENVRLWLGRAMCALNISGKVNASDPKNTSDSGGVVRVIYREHMKDEALRVQMEPSKTFSSKILGVPGHPEEEPFAIITGGITQALIHNAFSDGSDKFLNGPADDYTREDVDMLYIAEALINPKKPMKAQLVHLNNLNQPTNGEVKSAFLMTYDGDTEISSVNVKGSFDFFHNKLRFTKPALMADIQKIQSECVFNKKTGNTQTTIPASSKPVHFMLASFFLGKQSQDTFFRDNLMVQYVTPEHYATSKEGTADTEAYHARMKEHEEYKDDEMGDKSMADMAKATFEFMPQNIATLTDSQPEWGERDPALHRNRVLMPFYPEKDELRNIALHSELSGSKYWDAYKTSGKRWPQLLTDPITVTVGETITYPGFAALEMFLDPDAPDPYAGYANHNSVEVDGDGSYAGEPVDEESYVDPEAAAYAEEERQGLDA